MNYSSLKFRSLRKLAVLFLLVCSAQLFAITSNMTHRVMGTSPLLYKMIDYSKRKTCFEIEPIFSSMYEIAHTNANMILNGKNSLIFNQQGDGDLNPAWLNLMSNNTLADYNSVVTFTPSLTESGLLFHCYDQYESTFIDIKTALVQCRSKIGITEVGGNNGLIPGVLNAQQAFTQTAWNYGKIGQANHVVGLDNVELRIGGISKATSNASSYDLFIAGFGLIEAPTGSGTKAEWLFEPQVGTNHWGLGLGFEALVSGGDDLKFMIAGNYRYLVPAWETRSFDLIGNGQWSRYIAVQDMYGLPTAPAILGLPGINFFTQQAYIKGRSELNLYTRLQKQFRSSYFELSYNFLCIQKETIGTIKNIIPNYGLYALTGPALGGGGAATSNTAKINQDVTILDSITNTTALTSNNFDKLSAATGTYVTNTLAARLEIIKNDKIYGFGASIESAQSASAISSWAVWAKFEYLFDSSSTLHNDRQCPSIPYGFDPGATTIASDIITNIDTDIKLEEDDEDDDDNEPEEIIDNMDNDEINSIKRNIIGNDDFEFLEDEQPTFHEMTIMEMPEANTSVIMPTEQIKELDISMHQDLNQAQELLSAPTIVESIAIAPISEIEIKQTDNSDDSNIQKEKIPKIFEDTVYQTFSLEDHAELQSAATGLELKNHDQQTHQASNKNAHQTISLEDVSILSGATTGLQLKNHDDEIEKALNENPNETISLQSHSLLHPVENGLQLKKCDQQTKEAINEIEALNKLDSTK